MVSISGRDHSDDELRSGVAKVELMSADVAIILHHPPEAGAPHMGIIFLHDDRNIFLLLFYFFEIFAKR